MKKIVVVTIFITLFSNFAVAAFAIMKIEERVQKHNLIVIGKLQDVSESETEAQRISKGALVIEKVIFGSFTDSKGQNLKIGDKVDVKWSNSKMFACQFGFAENNKQVWFLNVDNQGNIESFHPSTSTGLEDLSEVKQQLKLQNKKDNLSKFIKIQNTETNYSITQPNQNDETVKCLYSIQEKPKKYSPFSALIVAIFSISLYFVLYRSRYKIR